MTSTRLSPAANLLRNSKLFALPSAVPLPPARPKAEAVFRSDTATTVHPVTAAIYTDSGSLAQGDWGLKRALPGKAFNRTTTPTIRLRSDIDTQEHIADFDSAADHVLTLQKWQNYPLVMTTGVIPKGQRESRSSAFHPTYDNTTAKPNPLRPSYATKSVPTGRWNDDERQKFLGAAEKTSDLASIAEASGDNVFSLEETLDQYKRDYAAEAEESGRAVPPPPTRSPPILEIPRRWRYEGPWIAGMTNMSFEEFLKQLDGKKIGAFREHLKKSIVARRQTSHAEAVADAQAAATEAPEPPLLEVSSEEVTQLLRQLRKKTNMFASEIASFFDLPDSLQTVSGGREWARPTEQQTAASPYHLRSGPPRTHPSAGFSYLRSDRYATMSPQYGPQNPQHLVPARHLKQLNYSAKGADGSEQRSQWGVGGFVVNVGQTGTRSDQAAWRTTNGGPKTAASISHAFVGSDGTVQLKANLNGGRLDDNNVPEVPGNKSIDSYPRGFASLPQMDHNEPRRMDAGRRTPGLYSRSLSSRSTDSVDPTDELENMFRRVT